MVLKIVSSIFVMTCFSFFAFAGESSIGLGQVKKALKSIRFQSQHLSATVATPDLIAQERDALTSRHLKIDTVTDFDEVIDSIEVSQHLVSFNIKF